MHIQTSVTMAVTIVSALCISLAVHVVNMLSLWRTGNVGVSTSDEVPELPITLRQAALTTIKSHRMGLHANASNLMPAGYGFIYDPQRDEHLFVAHYHQLHCLHALRRGFLNYNNLSDAQIGHVDHCFMYLHQALLCNVDTTLEPATHKQMTTEGKVVNAVTGFDVTHRCRDWGQLRGYMEDNYAQWAETYTAGGGDGKPVHVVE